MSKIIKAIKNDFGGFLACCLIATSIATFAFLVIFCVVGIACR